MVLARIVCGSGWSLDFVLCRADNDIRQPNHWLSYCCPPASIPWYPDMDSLSVQRKWHKQMYLLTMSAASRIRSIYLTVNILKHFFNGAQYNNCQPPGRLAHGFFSGSLHGGGTIAPLAHLYNIVHINMWIHSGEPFITKGTCGNKEWWMSWINKGFIWNWRSRTRFKPNVHMNYSSFPTPIDSVTHAVPRICIIHPTYTTYILNIFSWKANSSLFIWLSIANK